MATKVEGGGKALVATKTITFLRLPLGLLYIISNLDHVAHMQENIRI